VIERKEGIPAVSQFYQCLEETEASSQDDVTQQQQGGQQNVAGQVEVNGLFETSILQREEKHQAILLDLRSQEDISTSVRSLHYRLKSASLRHLGCKQTFFWRESAQCKEIDCEWNLRVVSK
jgi:hypothetical protein